MPNRDSAIEAAKKFIDQFFPSGEVAFLAGSIVRGEGTESSDLDIVIFDALADQSFRKSYLEFGWPIEAFVHSFQSYKVFFKENRDRARPSLPQMCAEGIILKDNGQAASIKNESLALLKRGPSPWKSKEVDSARYEITNLLDDLEGSNNPSEDLFIVSKLAYMIHEFILRVNGCWIGEGKWMVRALKEFDEEFALRFVQVFDEYYKAREKKQVIGFAGDVLDPYGGRLFEGYAIGKRE
ncbi:nucleotidyltransferase domain-containing protein [Fictibacillus sp. KIGAM418]|uniref:Nucleotidyltransferase domain-containing protein n=1 Tax=Fictibacillus marinisediminis TaxID=2878389 RepID=A0A9X1XA48_9BACL|nr:nucleotidyltransferase domain-containing protein [Fictibacillus marinisediminis]MCK6256881.1 nucleotidyltransferase domain-containing protein [Fictibacillus marinisediminis]